MKDLIKNRKTLAELCRFASLTGLALGTSWLVVFIAIQQWWMALSLLVLAALSALCWLVALRRSLSLGLIGAQIACTGFIVVFALLFDIPGDTVPRTTHLYLLVIALVGYMNIQMESSRIQLGVLAFTVLAFVALSSSSLSYPVAPPLPAEFHMARAWINAFFATFALCGGLYMMHTELSNSVRAAVELRMALDNQQLELFYQAQLNAQRQVVGAEALLRWKHPKRGYVSPAEFIAVAEKAGLMPDIGSWVIHEASKTLARWKNHPSTKHLSLSINVAAEQFMVSGFVEELVQAVERENFAAQLLKLELTENAFLSDMDSVVTKMHKLKKAGFEISLDDFGTGYSSLSYLRQLPLSQLKVDRSFVAGIEDNPRAAALTRNIVQIGHDLSLQVLAEGIETQAQFKAMQSFGCTAFQGFLFAKPMPIADFEAFVAHQQGTPSASPRT